MEIVDVVAAVFESHLPVDVIEPTDLDTELEAQAYLGAHSWGEHHLLHDTAAVFASAAVPRLWNCVLLAIACKLVNKDKIAREK